MDTQTMSLDYTPHTHLDTLPVGLADQVADMVRAGKRPNTLRAYRSDLAAFTAWCDTHHLTPLPASPTTLAGYLTDQAARLRYSTLKRHLATISKAHQVAGYKSERNPAISELVGAVMAGLRAEYAQAPKQAPGLSPELLRTVLAGIPTTRPATHGLTERPDPAGVRDRALLLVGWCAALRRSELSALTWGCVEWLPGGVKLHLLNSKTDKAGQGQHAPLATENDPTICPVAALEAWREVCARWGWSHNPDGEAVAGDDPTRPVFRAVNKHRHLGGQLSGHAVGAIITQRSAAAGVPGVTAHSLRRGLIQAAYLAGRDDSAILQTSRHRSVPMLRTYQGDAGLIERAASKGLLAQ